MLSKKKKYKNLVYDPREAENYQFKTFCLSSCTQLFSINIYFDRFLLIIYKNVVAHKLHEMKKPDLSGRSMKFRLRIVNPTVAQNEQFKTFSPPSSTIFFPHNQSFWSCFFSNCLQEISGT